MTAEELADEVIGIVQREPTEPTGLGMHRIVAGLFSQFAEKAAEAERERCREIAEHYLAHAGESCFAAWVNIKDAIAGVPVP